MAEVLVVTDSSACIPPSIAEALGINVLPISVHLPNSESALVEEADGTTWELTGDLEHEELASVSHPFVTEYLSVIETPGYEAALVVTPALEFSTMYRNAVLAAELASRPTVVHDARTAAGGQALVVLVAARAASAGADLETVLKVAEDASRRVELVASLATIAPIRRSGEVPADVLPEDDLSDERSLFKMRDGAIEPLGSTTSVDESLDLLVNAFGSTTDGGVEATTVFHADALELAHELEGRLGGTDFISGFSIAMQVYTGRGVVGIAWLPVLQ